MSSPAARIVPPPPPAPPFAVTTRPGTAWHAPAVTGALVAVGTAYTGIANPNTSHAFPLCPLKLLTGLDCPFCGCLRATHALVHGRLVEAASHNLLFTLAVPALVLFWGTWFLRSIGRPAPDLRLSRPVQLALLTVLAAFTVARNLPVPALHWLGSGSG